MQQSATAIASPNIAFIKYWGDIDPILRIPANGSISMNLSGLETRTQVTFDPSMRQDILIVNDRPMTGAGLERVSKFLDHVRDLANLKIFAYIESENNFPMGAGIASSASAFAALALASSCAAGLELNEAELSRLARTGSGSACRSIPEGFVEWQVGGTDEQSFAFSLATSSHWDLVDCIVVVSQDQKLIGSTEGHALAMTSPLQEARVADAPRRLEACRQAILNRDFDALSAIIELDSNLMHAVMLTSRPTLLYWQPSTVAVMRAVQDWRKEGLKVCYSIDAGPNVHVICLGKYEDELKKRLQSIKGVQQVLSAKPGGGARLLSS